MGYFRVLWDNKADAAVLAASSEAAGFGVERIQHEWFLKAWRSTGLSAETVDADLLAAEDVKAFFAYYINLRQGASFKIQADADPAYGSLDVDDAIAVTADMEEYGIVGKFWATAQAFRYWRQLISDDASAHPQGYIREGRAFLGDYFQPSERPSIPVKPQPVDPSVTLTSLGGQKSANLLAKYERHEFQWTLLPPAEIQTLREIFAVVGFSKPIFIIQDSEDPIGTLLYCRIVDIEFIPDGTSWYGVRLVVEAER